MTNKTWIT